VGVGSEGVALIARVPGAERRVSLRVRHRDRASSSLWYGHRWRVLPVFYNCQRVVFEHQLKQIGVNNGELMFGLCVKIDADHVCVYVPFVNLIIHHLPGQLMAVFKNEFELLLNVFPAAVV
jgi:hypothetical protein